MTGGAIVRPGTWTELDERQVWEIERRQAIREQQAARAEAEESRQYEERMAEAEAARNASVMTKMLSGEPVPTLGDILARAAASTPEAIPRDASKPYGSEENVALYVDGQDAGAPASQRPAAARAAQLARARRAGEDPFMLGQVALLERRQAASRPEASRSQAGRVNGSAVAAAGRLGIDDAQRDAHGQRMQCVMHRLPGGVIEHRPHGGRCVSPGGNVYRRWPGLT